ncbi:serine hydrolase domain-containing protein [Parapedobacter koreensis]|uniref:Beta-lactamase n=1 Tax=Parapedobacter koreensis TaxID=332977 RepID=A0A1H7S2H1_9SPHI|nr:serine hydrolase [Parapedobacter koreensis]SEL66685.1 Beta-lactamase [Parapedobacter koreensis]
MKAPIHWILLLVAAFVAHSQETIGQAAYFPPASTWQHQSPARLGLDAQAMDQAVEFAKGHEAKTVREGLLGQIQSFGREPLSDPIGPLQDRGGATGLVIYKGYIVAEWGDPSRVDITHSVTKSFLSTVVGLAVDQELIGSTTDTIASAIPPIEIYHAEGKTPPELIRPFESAHNRKLTWEVMLRQTSDWEGTLWDKPDWADRPQGDIDQWKTRERHEPGTVWKYNDVRVNALALAATAIWRKPLPQVLKEYIMDPIGASNTWHWTGYHNSWIVLNGQLMQSVSGGGHWGGGLFINAYDMARFGLLTLHHGNWNGKQLISEQWVKQALTPTTTNTGYGYMNWFLNTDKKLLPSAPEGAWVHIGNGTNMIYCDPEHDLVVVARWIENKEMDGLISNVLKAVR